jgi:hypothetical protein
VHGYASTKLYRFTTGKDAKRAILLAEETQSDIESAFYKEAVAKKYASFFQSTLHHNNGYFLQVKKPWTSKNIDCLTAHTACLVCLISTVNGRSKKR